MKQKAEWAAIEKADHNANITMKKIRHMKQNRKQSEHLL